MLTAIKMGIISRLFQGKKLWIDNYRFFFKTWWVHSDTFRYNFILLRILVLKGTGDARITHLLYLALHTSILRITILTQSPIWLIKSFQKMCICSLHFPCLLLKLNPISIFSADSHIKLSPYPSSISVLQENMYIFNTHW